MFTSRIFEREPSFCAGKCAFATFFPTLDGVGQRALSQEKLRYLFRLFDVSCDGCIDAEELGRLLFSMRVRVAEPELLVLLDRMDRCESVGVGKFF